MKKTRKVVSSLIALSLVGGLVLPAAGPAFAYSKNSVNKVVSIANDDVAHRVGDITITEDSSYASDFTSGDVFTLTLPSGVDWVPDGNDDGDTIDAADDLKVTMMGADYFVGSPQVKLLSDQKLQITTSGAFTAAQNPIVLSNIHIKADSGVTGDIKVKIDGKDSAITSQDLIIARALDGDTVATVDDIETIGDEVAKAGVITIEEAAVGSMGNNFQSVDIKLPSDFNWEEYNVGGNAFTVEFSGGFTARTFTVDGGLDKLAVKPTAAAPANGYMIDGQTLKVYFVPARVAGSNQRGIITITPYISPDNDADFGDVEVSVSGTKVSDADLVIAKYADYGTELSVKEVEELISGRFDEETAEITIKEAVPGSFIQGRKVTLEFPSWVKVTDFDITKDPFRAGSITMDDNEVQFTIIQGTANASSGGEMKFKAKFSIEAGKSGDIEMKINSKSGAEGSLVVAKAVAPVSAEAKVANVKIGVKGQAINDIIITENVDEAIGEEDAYGNKADLRVELTDGVQWNSYKVEVIEGNLEIDEDNIDDNGSELIIPIKSTSSKASKIKISGITVDLDRTIPEGLVQAKVKGESVVLNNKAQDGWAQAGGRSTTAVGDGLNDLDRGEFDTSNAVKIDVANVVTPAPEAGTVLFNIGSTIYTAGGVTKVMDAAPYIKEGRTYVPVRYLALALGVTEENIGFENGVVTLTKDNVEVKLTIGSTTLMNNDNAVTMDVAPEVVNGRTMLPARFVAEAFGAMVGYANGQVVISY